jgi:hypothetical protein
MVDTLVLVLLRLENVVLSAMTPAVNSLLPNRFYAIDSEPIRLRWAIDLNSFSGKGFDRLFAAQGP